MRYLQHGLLTLLLIVASLCALSFEGLAHGAAHERSTYGVLVRLGAHYTDKSQTPENIETTRRKLSSAVDAATSRKRERAILLGLGWHESRFAAYVVEYRCQDGPKDSQCDKGKATGPWQGHYAPTNNTEADARIALDRFKSALRYCDGSNPRNRLERAIANYATGSRKCEWVVKVNGKLTYPAVERANTIEQIEGWL